MCAKPVSLLDASGFESQPSMSQIGVLKLAKMPAAVPHDALAGGRGTKSGTCDAMVLFRFLLDTSKSHHNPHFPNENRTDCATCNEHHMIGRSST